MLQPRRVAFLSGDPTTPGHRYRVARYAESARSAGFAAEVTAIDEAEARLDVFQRADIVIVWRAWWDHRTAAVYETARQAGAALVFDIDDLLFEPELATYQAIDGLRSQRADPAEVATFFAGFDRTLAASDYCSAPTPVLVDRMQARIGRPGFLLPNGFDADTLARSRAAVAQRPTDGLLRMGYAGGTRTHQRDFAEAAPAVARILGERADARLVLFCSEREPLVDLHEFPELHDLADQVEWRYMRPLEELPEELARFDINLAPLQHGNLFCESKSELKVFEAALVAVPSIASPTGPFRAAVRHEETGLLAASPDQWYAALQRLAAQPALRTRIGGAAFEACSRLFGPERRAERFMAMAAAILRDRASGKRRR